MTTLHTPIHALPYPDGAERVMDGDNAIGALALATEGAIEARDKHAYVQVSGPVFTQTVVGPQKLPLSAVQYGFAHLFDDANDRLVLPPGFGYAGLWSIHAYGTAADYVANGLIRLHLRLNGVTWFGMSPPSYPTAFTYWNIGTVIRMSENDYLELAVECAAGDPGTIQVLRFGMARIGPAGASPVLLPAPEPPPE